MVTIKHKQINKTEVISITTWLKSGKYNHDSWDVVEIKDAVDLYALNSNGQWELHNIVEKDQAIVAIEATSNYFKYEDSTYNTNTSNDAKPIDKLLLEANSGTVLKREDSSDQRDKDIKTLLEGKLIEDHGPFYKTTEIGKAAISAGGYDAWQTTQRSRDETVLDILKEADERGFAVLHKSVTEQYRRALMFAVAKGLLVEKGKYSYSLTDKGYDVLEVGDYRAWFHSQSHNVHAVVVNNIGPQIHNSPGSQLGDNNHSKQANIRNSPITIIGNDNELSTQPGASSTQDSTSWHYWLNWIFAIFGSIAAIIGLYYLLVDKHVL